MGILPLYMYMYMYILKLSYIYIYDSVIISEFPFTSSTKQDVVKRIDWLPSLHKDIMIFAL